MSTIIITNFMLKAWVTIKFIEIKQNSFGPLKSIHFRVRIEIHAVGMFVVHYTVFQSPQIDLKKPIHIAGKNIVIKFMHCIHAPQN